MHRNGHYAFSTQAENSEPFAWFKSIKTYKDVMENFEYIIIEFVNLSEVEYYDQKELKPGEETGYIKISLAENWDPEGFVKFEVNLPDIRMLQEKNEKKGFEIIAIWES